VLLTLKAYQQHIAAAAGSIAAANASVASGGSGHDEDVALGCILQNFLRLAAQLSSSSLLSWELQYDRDTVQQVLTRPDLAAALRPQGCEQHPIILDPCCPTNNVAAAVADLSRLKQLAAADLDKVEGSWIALLEQQLQRLQQEQQATVQKLQQEHNAAVQQHSKQLAGLLLHQRAIGCGSQTFRWEFSMPVSKWLPGATEEVVAGPYQWGKLPGLWLQVVNKPYSVTAYGSEHLAGFDVRVAAGRSAEMASLSELNLPIPFTAPAHSTLTLEAVKDSSRGYTTREERTCQLDAGVSGSMCGAAGALIVFKRSLLQRLDLADYAYKEYDAGKLEQTKNRTLKIALVFKFSA
jgi:hypothetical protein